MKKTKLLLIIAASILLTGITIYMIHDLTEPTDGKDSGVPMVSLNGRVFFSVGNGEKLADGYSFWDNIQTQLKSSTDIRGTHLKSKYMDSGKKVYTNKNHPEVLYVKDNDTGLYDVFVENGFYLLHLINVNNQIYVPCTDLLNALEFKQETGDLSWATKITKKDHITLDYEKNIAYYDSLGPLSCSDEYGKPTINMTCPGWGTKGIFGDVFRHKQEGYLVVGELNSTNEIKGIKYIKNEP